MSFDKQVSETCKACYFHIRALRHIHASLTTEASKTIAAAILGFRLDFCNSLLAGTSVSNLPRLQHIQPGLRHLVALGKIKIGGPSTSALTSNFSETKMPMQTPMCWVYICSTAAP